MQLIKTPLGVSVQTAPDQTLPIRAIICVGKNYEDHAKEQGAKAPERPVLFTKNPLSACLHADAIVIPPICQDRPQVDFEGELAVLIDRAPSGDLVRDVAERDALACVLGYCIANDVSARWWQKDGSGGQFYRGKSFDTFCPIGPRITPARDVPDPQSLTITTRVNGQVMQHASTASMLFSVARLVSEISRAHTILPGTLILTGTPAGVGFARTPPVFLAQGDVVEVTIDQPAGRPSLGTLRNSVTLAR